MIGNGAFAKSIGLAEIQHKSVNYVILSLKVIKITEKKTVGTRTRAPLLEFSDRRRWKDFIPGSTFKWFPFFSTWLPWVADHHLTLQLLSAFCSFHKRVWEKHNHLTSDLISCWVFMQAQSTTTSNSRLSVLPCTWLVQKKCIHSWWIKWFNHREHLIIFRWWWFFAKLWMKGLYQAFIWSMMLMWLGTCLESCPCVQWHFALGKSSPDVASVTLRNMKCP